jgi:ketosteroid isomerase-like protein
VSQENVEIIRMIYDDWLHGEMAIDRFHPEIAMVESKMILGAPSAYGIDAVRRYMESFPKYWAEIRPGPEEYIDAGDQVVVVARLVGRGKTSGVDVERKSAYVWTLRANRALRIDACADRTEALEAVGLAE